MEKPDTLATRRMQAVMQVQAGLITAKEAARQLQISRSAYYKWEEKALMAMYSAVTNGDAGRPLKESDLEKVELNNQVAQLQKQVLFLEQDREIRKILFGDINPGVEEPIVDKNKKKGSRKKKKKSVINKGKRPR